MPASTKIDPLIGLMARTEQVLALTREILETSHYKSEVDKALKDLALDIRNIILK